MRSNDRVNVRLNEPEQAFDPAELLQRAEAELARVRAELLLATAKAARAEGRAEAMQTALADLAGRLDAAELRLAQPWWTRLFG